MEHETRCEAVCFSDRCELERGHEGMHQSHENGSSSMWLGAAEIADALRPHEPSDDERAALAAWLADRPPAVQEKARQYPPWPLYEVIPTGQHARITSYSEGENGTCETCCIDAWYDYFPMPVGVFGMPFTDLRPLSVSPSEQR